MVGLISIRFYWEPSLADPVIFFGYASLYLTYLGVLMSTLLTEDRDLFIYGKTSDSFVCSYFAALL